MEVVLDLSIVAQSKQCVNSPVLPPPPMPFSYHPHSASFSSILHLFAEDLACAARDERDGPGLHPLEVRSQSHLRNLIVPLLFSTVMK